MSKLLQLRGGTTSEHGSFTGAVREVTVDTTKDTLVVHDGSTAGGHALLKEGDVTNANFTGADLEIAKGGTGASSAGAARTALGLAIGSDIETFNANKYPSPTITGTNTTATNASFHIASAGGITITLPASPSAGNYVIIKDGTGAAETTTFTVARNGSNIASSATDLTFDKNFAEIVMTYVNSTIGWSV